MPAKHQLINCPGPPPHFAYRFSTAPTLGTDAPAWFRPEFGPVSFRRRLDGAARPLVVGQEPSTDEQLANRRSVGRSRQRLQRFLHELGLTTSAMILNAFHLVVKGHSDHGLSAIHRNAGPLGTHSTRGGTYDKITWAA